MENKSTNVCYSWRVANAASGSVHGGCGVVNTFLDFDVDVRTIPESGTRELKFEDRLGLGFVLFTCWFTTRDFGTEVSTVSCDLESSTWRKTGVDVVYAADVVDERDERRPVSGLVLPETIVLLTID